MPNAWSRAWRSMLGRRKAPAVRTEPPRLGPGGPPAGTAFTPRNRRRQQEHPIIGADVTKLHSILLRAFDGEPQRLQDLYDDMQDRDDRVGPVCRTRLLVMQGRPHSLHPPPGFEDDDRAHEIARNVSTILSRVHAAEGTRAIGGWKTVVGNIGDAVLRGYSVNEVEWGVSTEGWHVPKRIHWRHPNRFVFGESFDIAKKDLGDPARGVPLEEFGPDKFIVHSPVAGRPAYPTRRGVMLPMVLPSMGKRFGIKYWLKAVQRWGQPLPYAKLPKGHEHLIDDVEEMLNAMTENWTGAVVGDIDLQIVPGSGNLDPEVHKAFIDLHNTSIAIIGLGQNLSTEVSEGSYAAARIANLIRLDLLMGDLAELDDSITAQLIEPIVRYNWPGEPVPVYRTEIEQQEPFTLEDVKQGVASANEYRQGKGHEARDDPRADEYRTPPELASAPPEGGAEPPDPFDPTSQPERTATSTATASQGASRRTSPTSTSRRGSALYNMLAASEPTRSKPS